MGPTIISKQATNTFIEIYVEFINGRPTSDLELVLKNEAGVIYKSYQVKEGEVIHWNLDTFVHFGVSHYSHKLMSSAQLCSNPYLCYAYDPANAFKSKCGSD